MQYLNLSDISYFPLPLPPVPPINLYAKQEQRNCLLFLMDQNSSLKERETIWRGYKYQKCDWIFIPWHHELSLSNSLGFVPKSLACSLKLYVYLKSQQSFHLQCEIIKPATSSCQMSISHAKQNNSLILGLSLKFLKGGIWKNDYLFIMSLLIIWLKLIQRDSAQDCTLPCKKVGKKKLQKDLIKDKMIQGF